MHKVFINGSEGTTGLRLKSRLSARDDVELLEIDTNLRRDPGEVKKYMAASDFSFLCLPDEAARDAVALAEGLSCRIIDASTAHRTLDCWVYGFPELNRGQRSEIANAKRVAVPGCHATGFIALARPLIDSGLVPPDYPLSCMSLTGYSGGGKAMIADYEAKDRETFRRSPMAYALNQSHKHLREMKAHGGVTREPVFLPVVGDFYSGMLVTLPLPKGVGIEAARKIYSGHYAGAALVHVSVDEPAALYAGAMSGRDDLTIYVTGAEGRVLAHALFDNLGKGASGAAIQCLNLMMGAKETSGLIIS